MFDDYLSAQGKARKRYSTPLADMNAAATVREEVYGSVPCCEMPSQKDMDRLREAHRREYAAQELFRTGTLEKE
jgi:hypothetical protein